MSDIEPRTLRLEQIRASVRNARGVTERTGAVEANLVAWCRWYAADVAYLLDLIDPAAYPRATWPPPRRPVDANVAHVGVSGRETSKEMQRRALPRAGLVRRLVYDFVLARGRDGATDDEVQVALGLGHSTGSSSCSTLRRDGWLVPALDDQGRPMRRRTRAGNWAYVWRAVAEGR